MSSTTATNVSTSSSALGERSLRIAFLTVMPSPYMQDLFDVMAQDPRFDLSVNYLEMAAPDTYWGQVTLPRYAAVLSGKWFNFFGARIHYNPGATRRIIGARPDLVVVSGYSGLTNQLLMRALNRLKVPWIFHGELSGMSHRNAIGTVLRTLARRPAVRWPSGIAAVGSKAAAGYRALARHNCPIANIAYCCDMQPFFSVSRRPAQDGQVRFLYCGQLIHRKGVDVMLEAFIPVARCYPSSTLTIVGEGELRDDLIRGVPKGMRQQIQFAGFRPIADLPSAFAVADVLILPSRHDGWGVVVNQALAAGLAIACSDTVGAAADLVEGQGTGIVFKSADVGELGRSLMQLASSSEQVVCMGDRARQLAEQWTPQQAVDRWYRLCHQALSYAQSAKK